MAFNTQKTAGYREGPLDLILGALAILLGLMGIFASQMNLESYLGFIAPASISSPKIAILDGKEGLVRHQNVGSPIWTDVAGETEALRIGDSVFTGPAGVARIRYDDGQELTVLPNSLIVIQGPDTKDSSTFSRLASWLQSTRGKHVVEIQKGSAELSSTTGQGSLDIRVGNRLIKLDAKQGRATQISADADSTMPSDAEVIGPKPEFGQRILPGKNGSITLSWESIDPASPAGYVLEIKGERSISLPIQAAQKSIEVPLPKGNYQWRLSCSPQGSGPCSYSRWMPFSIQNVASPELFTPRDRAHYQAAPQEQALGFSWRSDIAAKSGRIEITDLASGGRFELKTDTAGNIAAVMNPGSFRWRAKDDYADGRAAEWSNSREFSISPYVAPAPPAPPKPVPPPLPPKAPPPPPPPPPPKPTLRTVPGQASTLIRGNAADQAVRTSLNWNAIPGAKEYNVAFFGADQKAMGATKTEGTSYAIALKTGTPMPSYFQISAKAADGSMIVSPLTPVLSAYSAPAKMETRAGKGTVLLSWERTLLSSAYEVEVHLATGQSKIMPAKLNFLTVPLPKNAQHGSWRVRSLYPSGPSAWSASKEF